jgi:hypothetical protein
MEDLRGFAFLSRLQILESVSRYKIYKKTPPSIFAPYVERVPLLKGRIDPKGTTTSAYGWLVWLKDHAGPCELRWVTPCRKQFERPSDYDI